jgi:acyl carrier protein
MFPLVGGMGLSLDALNAVFRDVFDDDSISVTPSTTAKDIDGWTSVMHVSLIVSVERAFGVRFRSHEVAGLKNVGELIAMIESKGGTG